MPPSHTAAVFFDMDETLVQHTRPATELLRELYAEYKHHLGDVDEAAFARTLWRKANDLWHMMFDGVLSGEVARPYTFINTLRHLKADESIAHAMLKRFEDQLIESTRLDSDALHVLESLRSAGIRTAVITNGYTAVQSRKIKHHDLDNHVDFVLISEAVGFHKPHPAIFETALGKAGVKPHQALVIGDNLNADIAGAAAAGIPPVLYDPKGSRRKVLEDDPALTRPAHIIERHTEVLSLAGIQKAAANE